MIPYIKFLIQPFGLLTLILICPHAVYSGVLLSNLDFWTYEHLENQELRGEPARQLNTRPLVNDSISRGGKINLGFVISHAKVEYSCSSNLPFVQNREGNWISAGHNLLSSIGVSYLSEDFSIWLEPLASLHEHRDSGNAITPPPISSNNIMSSPDSSGSYSEATLQSAYVLIPFSNWYLFAGKDSQQFGSGKHDTLHFSNSHEPFPMIRLGTLSPWETWLGSFSFLTYIGELEKERHIPNAKFSGIRLNWNTSKRLEVGISRSWLAGGENQNNSFSHVFWDLYSEFFKPTSGIEQYDDFRNQQLVMDFRLKIPELKAVIYGEFGREDHEHDIGGVLGRWYHTQANIIGYKQIDLFVENLFFILERAETVERYPFPEFIPWFETSTDPPLPSGTWYNHYQYLSGWTYKGIGLGHHLGSDSVDEFFAIGWESDTRSVKLFIDREVHGVLTVQPENREEKLEVGIDGFLMLNHDWQISYLLMTQNFSNFGQIAGNSLETSIISIGTKYLF